MAPLERLLADLRLIPTAPYTSQDIAAAEARINARLARREAAPEPKAEPEPEAEPEQPAPTRREAARPGRRREDAELDLAELCHTFLTRPGSRRELQVFIDDALPDSGGARMLGCVLALTGGLDGARFWWQYAAGAGDRPAAYCLALYHRAHGEEREAAWWTTWNKQYPAPAESTGGDPEQSRAEARQQLRRALVELGVQNVQKPPTTGSLLRVLRRLRVPGRLPARGPAAALAAYVPAAVGYRDEDVELPLPDPDFLERVEQLLLIDDAEEAPAPPDGGPADPLPERPVQRRPAVCGR